MKIRPVGAQLFHADGQTDTDTEGRTYMTKLIGAFYNFAQAPSKSTLRLYSAFIFFVPFWEQTEIVSFETVFTVR
jgi:23S rRNA C2498 (ribose-2'-O)-methylase RlmM